MVVDGCKWLLLHVEGAVSRELTLFHVCLRRNSKLGIEGELKVNFFGSWVKSEGLILCNLPIKK